MQTKAKKVALCGMMLALTEVFISLGSVIETNTLFLLAAASYFVGIVIREFQIGTGIAFYISGVLLGIIVSPNKFYVVSYAVMGAYILFSEYIGEKIGKMDSSKNRNMRFRLLKYCIFNVLYLPLIVLVYNILAVHPLSGKMMIILILAGQPGWYIYDHAYAYVQINIWNKLRGKLLY